MKPSVKTNCLFVKRLRMLSWSVLLCATAFATSHAQTIYVARDGEPGSVGSYNALTGDVINAALITGLSAPYALASDGQTLYVGSIGSGGIVGAYNMDGTVKNAALITGIQSVGLAVSGNNLYATNYLARTVGLYNATTGAAISAPLITGAGGQTRGITLDGAGNIYMANLGDGTVSKYSSNGTLLNASLISGLNGPFGLALDDQGNIFVSNFSGTTVGRYDATTGEFYNFFISSLVTPTGLAYRDGLLYVAQYNSGIVGTYNATTGAPVNIENWITGAVGVTGIVVTAVPEPSTVVMLILGGSFLLFVARRKICRS